MAPRRAPSKSAIAAETWRRLFDFFISTSRQRNEALRRHRLTPNDARALSSLSPREGRTMRSLADEWGCDASNATWIVDRLERRGLAERRADPTDRRVRLVRLTALGVKTRDRLHAAMHEPPPELLALDLDALEALQAALARLPEGRRP